MAKALGGCARGDAAPGRIAIDGKTLKGTRRLDAKALHVLSAFATGLSAVNRVVPHAESDAEVDRWCKEILLRLTAIAIAKCACNADS